MSSADEKKMREIQEKKLVNIEKIRTLKAEIAKINKELFVAGVSIHDVMCW